MPCATAGQRAAATALGEAVAQRQPLILLFGDAGVGKTTLISSFLTTVDPQEFFVVQVSATSGEFVGPPSFDALLEVICRRLVAMQPAGQRPATLAVLAAAVGALARAGRTVLLAIDHADHLTNDVIAEATRLGEYLDASPASLVCIFIGSPTLASRLDAALRRPGAAPRVSEIRVSHPSGDELAALLAYEDTAQPGGPILTPGAIDRISMYAKANLHWATPLADAARTLAANQGEREVTPELVRGALFELWSPEQPQLSDTITRLTSNPIASASNPDSVTMTAPGMSDIPLGSLYGVDASVTPVSPSTVDPASSVKLPPGSPAESTTSGAAVSQTISTWRPGALRIALAATVLLLIIGIVALALRDVPKHIGQQPPGSEQTESQLPTPQPPGPQGEGEAKRPEQQHNQINQVPPAEPMPSDAEPSGSDHGETAGSASDQTADTVPALPKIAPTTPPVSGAPAPAPRAPTTKKAAAPKAPKQDYRQVPLHPWIQTR
jgi:type II secretory pathway predicted ATPase ExeA